MGAPRPPAWPDLQGPGLDRRSQATQRDGPAGIWIRPTDMLRRPVKLQRILRAAELPEGYGPRILPIDQVRGDILHFPPSLEGSFKVPRNDERPPAHGGGGRFRGIETAGPVRIGQGLARPPSPRGYQRPFDRGRGVVGMVGADPLPTRTGRFPLEPPGCSRRHLPIIRLGQEMGVGPGVDDLEEDPDPAPGFRTLPSTLRAPGDNALTAEIPDPPSGKGTTPDWAPHQARW
jgi:hypothetical protein